MALLCREKILTFVTPISLDQWSGHATVESESTHFVALMELVSIDRWETRAWTHIWGHGAVEDLKPVLPRHSSTRRVFVVICVDGVVAPAASGVRAILAPFGQVRGIYIWSCEVRKRIRQIIGGVFQDAASTERV
jgi:hypothetical protein